MRMQLASSWILRRDGTPFGERPVNQGDLESSKCSVASEQLPEGLPGDRSGSHKYRWLLITFVYM